MASDFELITKQKTFGTKQSMDLHIRMLISSQNSDFQISSMYCEALKEIRSLKMASS